MSIFTDRGTTSDTIQSAINTVNSIGGGTVYLTSGTYTITSELTIYSNVTLEGVGPAGSVLLDATSMSVVSGLKYIINSGDSEDKTNINIKNIGFVGKFTHGTVATYAQTPGVGGILINNCRRITVENCYFIDCWNASTLGISGVTYDASLDPLNVKDVTFLNNRVYECLGGLQVYGGENINWIGNHFYKFADDAIALLSVDAGSAPHSSNATITGNTFQNGTYQNDNGVDGVGIAVKLDGGSDPTYITNVTIGNNIIKSTYIGIQNSNSSEVTINNNQFDTITRSGIYISGTSDSKIRINDNYFQNCNTSGNTSHAVIQSLADADVDVINNHIQGGNIANERGIFIESNPSRVLIKGNKLRSIGNKSIYANATDIEVENNSIVGGSNSTYGIQLDSCTGYICESNRLSGTFTSQAIDANAASGVIDNNYLDATKTGILLSIASGVSGDNFSMSGNKAIGLTGSTTDGEAALKITLNSSTSVESVIVDNNIVLDGGTSYYQALVISGSADINYIRVVGNHFEGNKYGLGVNCSGAVTSYTENNNVIKNNSSYNINRFTTALTSPEIDTGRAAAANVTGAGNGETITTADIKTANYDSGGAARTGVILQAGTYHGQTVKVCNVSDGSSETITFAASGTSNVANGASEAITQFGSKVYTWNATRALWY